MYKPSEKSFFPAHHPLQVTANTAKSPPPPGRGGRGEVAGAQIGEEHPGRGRGRTDHGMMGNAIFRPIWPWRPFSGQNDGETGTEKKN